MFFITKEQYFAWIEAYSSYRQKYNSASNNNLKDVQDHYAISLLAQTADLKVLEVGGGDCRVLRNFADRHECWNAERFEGAGIGPTVEYRYPGIKNISAYLGDFSSDLPSNYFDLVFSISVVEHIEDEKYASFIQDISRILKPGGVTAHAVDVYLFDRERLSESFAKYAKRRLQLYKSTPALADYELRSKHPLNLPDDPIFRCDYATNSDREMLAWNKYAPSLQHIRAVAQSASLVVEFEKV